LKDGVDAQLPDSEDHRIRVLWYDCFLTAGYVFEAYDQNRNRKVALKRIEKVGNQLSR
jgi:hypothetical protein